MPTDVEAQLARLTPAQRAEVALLVAELERRRAERPLAYASLWHRDAPRTSQRRAAQAAMDSGALLAFIMGGNRAGKTQLAAQLCVAYALGRDHQDVKAWAKRNHIDVSGIQRGPGRVAFGALTSSDSRRYIRPAVAAVLPGGARWRNREGDGESEVTLPGGGRIVFKSVEQGREGWQGERFHAVLFDEEPPLPVVREALMRVVDFAGRLIFSMTPLSGWTPLLEEYVRDPAKTTRLSWIFGEDNPHIPVDILESLLASMGPHERAARARGEITALEGRVYPFHRALHVVPSFAPPLSWPRFVGWDFGFTNPTAILWCAFDANSDTIHVYREHYARGRTADQHGRDFLALHGSDPMPQWIVSDTDAGVRATLRAMGIYTQATKKQDSGPDRMMRLGISAIASRMDVDGSGRVRLLIHDCCTATIREMDSYVWDAGKESPKKANDHAMDALRYVVQLGVRSGWWTGPPQIQDDTPETPQEADNAVQTQDDGGRPSRDRGRAEWR